MTTLSTQPAIGVLALQGDVIEHVAAMNDAGGRAFPVKTLAQLEAAEGIIIPGGESTTVGKLMDRFGLSQAIASRTKCGTPLWGTCMGLIVIAREVAGEAQPTLGLLDVCVRRNAFGRQNQSAEIDLSIPACGAQPFPAIFIRAPWIENTAPDVEVLARREGHGVMVRQGNVLGTSFHPELTPDRRVHEYFLRMVEHSRAHGVGKQRSVA